MSIPTTSGLKLWIDPTDPNCYTLSSGTNNLTQLNDKSGLGNNATVSIGTGTKQFIPNRLNGLNAFNLSYAGFQGNFDASNTGPTLSFFFIASINSYPTFARIFALGNNDGTNDGNVIPKMSVYPGGIGRNGITISFSNVLNKVYLYSGYFDGSKMYFSTNGGTYTSRDSSGNFAIGRYSVGCDTMVGEVSNSLFGEILAYDTNLSILDRQNIEAYLSWKWGLTLPNTNPYYYYPPVWLQNITANRFSNSYIQGFTDISGTVVLRNKNLIVTNGDLSYLSPSITTNILPTYTNGNIIAYDISCNNNILVNGNTNINSFTIQRSFTTNTFTSTNTNINITGNMIVNKDASFNSNNIIISGMTVGILKQNSSGIATSCGCGYNIVNTALSNISSNLQNNVIIGGNIAPLERDINYSTLIGSNVLYNSTQFYPSDIIGLQLWVDASDPNSYTLSGSNITQLKDKSGNGNNTTGYYGTQPTFQTNVINSLPVFNMANGGFIGNFNSTNIGTTLSFFMILILNTNATYPRILALGNDNTSNDSADIKKICLVVGPLPISLWRNNVNITTTNSMSLNVPYLVSGYFDGTKSYLGVNGTYVSIDSTNNFNISKYGIGMNTWNNGEIGNFKYGELLVFNNALSTSDIQEMEGYLAWKWGTNSSLPINHPYYNININKQNITAIGAFAAANPGDKTNSTYIGAFAGTDPINSTISYNQINNTFIGGNTFAGNDANNQTSIGYGCIKTVASPNIMYIGTTAETVYFPNKLNIGAVPGSLGNLNVDGNGLFLGSGTVNVQNLSMNLNGATYNPGNFSVANMINIINNSGFILNAEYNGTWTVGDNFGMMGGVQSDASSVIYMPECYIFAARAISANTVSGTNIYLSLLKNGIDVDNSTNRITFNTTDSSLNTYANNTNGFGLKINQADQLSLRYANSAGGSITMSGGGTQTISVTLFCTYSYQPTSILDTLTSVGYNSCTGAYGSRLLNANYYGPVMSLMSSGGTGLSSDFYSDTSGNLITQTGLPLLNWLINQGGNTNYAFINILYDQSVISSNHATQTITSSKPIYDIANKILNFGYNGVFGGITSPNNTGFLNLPDGTVPFENSSYTVTTKHRYSNNYVTGTWLTSGPGGSIANMNKSNSFRFDTTRYRNDWWYNDAVGGTININNVITFKYDSNASLTTMYANSSSVSLINSSRGSRSSTNTRNIIGENLQGELYYLYIFSSPLSDTDRNIIGSTTFT
jgi:hypothetical protein